MNKEPDFLNQEPAKSNDASEQPSKSDKSVFADDDILDDELSLLQTEKKPTKPESTQKPKIVSSTLGEIYLSQGKFNEALEIFQELINKEPDNEKLKRKLKDIEALIANN